MGTIRDLIKKQLIDIAPDLSLDGEGWENYCAEILDNTSADDLLGLVDDVFEAAVAEIMFRIAIP